MDSVSGVGVLDKAMLVLRAVADRPSTLGELQTATGLPRATAHRLAGALEEHGLLRRTPTADTNSASGWCRSARLPPNGSRSSTSLDRRSRSSCAGTGESVQLFVREGSQRRCVVSLESPHGLRWIVPQGSLLPLDVGSAGRVLTGEAAKAGWIQSIGEREPGVASVSAPVPAPDGSIVAAVSVSGPIERLTRQPGRRFGDAVVAAADEISAAL